MTINLTEVERVMSAKAVGGGDSGSSGYKHVFCRKVLAELAPFAPLSRFMRAYLTFMLHTPRGQRDLRTIRTPKVCSKYL